ncbi:MAG: hypothetical protein CFE21_05975 [Bacteroidetes bacterium B1(2017)]|nr:MAG: hypothetical protein CFE21_05975 [Bacteroidetes bacterium B1(2017)]
MKEEIKFHLANSSDTEAVVKILKQFSDESNGMQAPDLEEKLTELRRDYFRKQLNKNYICWYATINGEMASIAGLICRDQPPTSKNLSGKWGYLFGVYTLPEYRRKGLSKNILQRLMHTAMERGITAFELHATKEGEIVYIKEGFEIYSEPTYRKIVTA